MAEVYFSSAYGKGCVALGGEVILICVCVFLFYNWETGKCPSQEFPVGESGSLSSS